MVRVQKTKRGRAGLNRGHTVSGGVRSNMKVDSFLSQLTSVGETSSKVFVVGNEDSITVFINILNFDGCIGL